MWTRSVEDVCVQGVSRKRVLIRITLISIPDTWVGESTCGRDLRRPETSCGYGYGEWSVDPKKRVCSGSGTDSGSLSSIALI